MRRVLFLQDVKKFEWSLNMHSVGFFWWFLLLWVCWNISNRDTTNEDEYQSGKSLLEICQNWSELIEIYHNMATLKERIFLYLVCIVTLKILQNWSFWRFVCNQSYFLLQLKTLVQNIWQFKKMMVFFLRDKWVALARKYFHTDYRRIT